MERSKKIIAVFLVLANMFCHASDSLPIVNRFVLQYAESKLGKKVGSGICFALVDKALEQASPQWKRREARGLFGRKREFVYGEKIKANEILPGDVVYFKWKYRNGRRIYSHVAIYSVSEKEVKVLEQNADGSLAKSKVKVNPLFLENDREIKYWKIKYYHPY